jgi:hypothetical protein
MGPRVGLCSKEWRTALTGNRTPAVQLAFIPTELSRTQQQPVSVGNRSFTTIVY